MDSSLRDFSRAASHVSSALLAQDPAALAAAVDKLLAQCRAGPWPAHERCGDSCAIYLLSALRGGLCAALTSLAGDPACDLIARRPVLRTMINSVDRLRLVFCACNPAPPAPPAPPALPADRCLGLDVW